MSAYVSFFIRVNDNFAPIGSWSRSSKMYGVMSNRVPYEKMRALTITDLQNAINEINLSIKEWNEALDERKEEIKMVMNAANASLKEKLEEVSDIRYLINEIKEDLEAYEDARNTLAVYIDILDNVKYSETRFENDYKHYLYAGIEVAGTIDEISDLKF